MTSVSSSGNSRRNSPTAFSIHHLLGSNDDTGKDCCNQSDSETTTSGSDKVTTAACEATENNKGDDRNADLMHILGESLSHRAVGCDADRFTNVLRMLSSFIANLSRLHQNVPLPPVLLTQQPPILSQMSPTFLHLKSASEEGDRVGYNCDSDQLASLETGGELEERELQSTIAGGALSSLINMTFSKMLTLAEAKTLKNQVLKAQDNVAPVMQLSTNKLRKTRTTFTTSQLAQLEVYFGRQKYLKPADRDHIAGELGLSSAQVITWFQNRRAKNRRERLELERDILVLGRKKQLKNGPPRTVDSHADHAFVEYQPTPDSEGGLSTDRTIFPGSMLL